MQERRPSHRPDPRFSQLLGRHGGALAKMLQAAVDPELGQFFLDAVL